MLLTSLYRHSKKVIKNFDIRRVVCEYLIQ
jgi:hypothetical protein